MPIPIPLFRHLREISNEDSLNNTQDEPIPEEFKAEELIFDAWSVIFGVLHKIRAIEFFINDSKDNDRQSRIEDVVALEEKSFIQGIS